MSINNMCGTLCAVCSFINQRFDFSLMHFSAATDPNELKAVLKRKRCCKSYAVNINKVIIGNLCD